MTSIIAGIANTEYGMVGIVFGGLYLLLGSFVIINHIYNWYTYDPVLEKKRKDEEKRIKDEKITNRAKQYAIVSTRERILHTLADENPMYDEIYAEEMIKMEQRIRDFYYPYERI